MRAGGMSGSTVKSSGMSARAGWRGQRRRLAEILAEIDLPHLQGLLPGEGEEAFGQFGAAAPRGMNAVDQLRSFPGRRDRFLKQAAIAQDHGQQIVEIVRDAAGKLADHLHFRAW